MTLDVPENTELLGGVIYDGSPRNEPHRFAVRELNALLVKRLDDRYAVQVQDAVAVPAWHGRDAPEVDVAIIARKRYDPMPTAADAYAFIEVSDTTYATDRMLKIPLYVAAGVPAWIVNIPLRQVEFYGSETDLELQHGQVFDEKSSVEIPGLAISVSSLL